MPGRYFPEMRESFGALSGCWQLMVPAWPMPFELLSGPADFRSSSHRNAGIFYIGPADHKGCIELVPLWNLYFRGQPVGTGLYEHACPAGSQLKGRKSQFQIAGSCGTVCF